MSEVSLFRLYLLRATYLLIVVGLAFTIWPQLIHHGAKWPHWYGVGCSLLATVSVLAAIGIRYPLKMLPLLFFELTWKIIWFIAVAFRMWSTDQMDAATAGTVADCMVGIIIAIVIPWPYVFAQYVKSAGDRWK